MFFPITPLLILLHLKDSINISKLLNESNRLVMDNITIENIMPSDSSNFFETLIPIITLFLGFF
jgi:hypothetical protein